MKDLAKTSTQGPHMREAIVSRGRKIGCVPATGELFMAFNGTVYLVAATCTVNYGTQEEFDRKVAENRIRFRPV